MANEEQLAILKQGVEVWNKWRRDNRDVEIDLSEVSLMGANLGEANLFQADLRKADLSKADLRKANLIQADLTQADLTQADLTQADLIKANLRGAYLDEADLYEADLSLADISYAQLGDALLMSSVLEGATLIKSNLSGANLILAALNEAKLVEADLSEADLFGADLINADLSKANLTYARLIEADLSGATLAGCNIYGISAWNLKLEGTEQSNLVITRDNEPTIMVDDLEVAQFIYMLLSREKLRNVLNTMTHKGVLILGRFADGGLEVLQAVAGEIREKGYLPMLFDFDKCDSLNFTQIVKVMVGLSRFVIADLSGPSVLKELEATVPSHNIPFIPIIEKGWKYPSMSVDLSMYPWFHWPPVPFANKEKLVEELQETVINPAEELGKTREERRALLFSNTDR